MARIQSIQLESNIGKKLSISLAVEYLRRLEMVWELSVETCLRSLAGCWFFFLPLGGLLIWRCCFLRMRLSLELPAEADPTLAVRFLRYSSVEAEAIVFAEALLCVLRPGRTPGGSRTAMSMRISPARSFVVCGFWSPVNLVAFVSISSVQSTSTMWTIGANNKTHLKNSQDQNRSEADQVQRITGCRRRWIGLQHHNGTHAWCLPWSTPLFHLRSFVRLPYLGWEINRRIGRVQFFTDDDSPLSNRYRSCLSFTANIRGGVTTVLIGDIKSLEPVLKNTVQMQQSEAGKWTRPMRLAVWNITGESVWLVVSFFEKTR